MLADSTGNPAAAEIAPFKNMSNWASAGYSITGITASWTGTIAAGQFRFIRAYSYLPTSTTTQSTQGEGVLIITKIA
jgi:hypothetical protein